MTSKLPRMTQRRAHETRVRSSGPGRLQSQWLHLLVPVAFVFLMGCAGMGDLLMAHTRTHERAVAENLAPASLAAQDFGPEPALRRRIRVRVYADREYRAQVLNWEQSFERILETASGVTRGPFGVVFELQRGGHWTHEASEDPNALLASLREHDSGAGADLVVGLIRSLTFVSGTHHSLGWADTPGRHALMRGMENPEEHRALTLALANLPDDDRSRLYLERKRHKQAVVFLHEWAHSLGVPHAEDEGCIQSPLYLTTHSAFSEEIEALLRAALDQRERAGEGGQLAESERPGRMGKPDTAAGEALTGRASPPGDPGAFDPAGSSTGSREIRARLEQAGRALEANDAERARVLLGTLPEERADDAHVQYLACAVAIRTDSAAPVTAKRCTHAAELAPSRALPHLYLLHHHAARRDVPAALESAAKVRQLLDGPEGKAPDRWLDLADALMGLEAVTLAEEIAARHGQHARAEAVLRWAGTARLQFALPSEGAAIGVPPALEPEYVHEVRLGIEEANAGRRPEAAARAKQLAQRFPEAAGAELVRCMDAGRGNRWSAAHAECGRVVRKVSRTTTAAYLLSMAELNLGKVTSGTRRLEALVEQHPEFEPPYTILATVLQAERRRADLEALRKGYKARFGRALVAAPNGR